MTRLGSCTRKMLIAQSLAANPDLLAAQAALRQANENVYAGQGALFPTVSANAQAARPSDYIMIPADVVGGSNAVIYMIDTREGMLNARSLDLQGNALIDLGAPIDLKRVLGGHR